MKGWIKFYRKSLDHWLYMENRPKTRREAWEDMILLCNHMDGNILVNGELIDCKSGQTVMSLKSWSRQFKWSIQKVRTFLKLLEDDDMIMVEGLRKTTRITICNYALYQNNPQRENTEKTQEKLGDSKQRTTNKNKRIPKKNNNDKNILYQSSIDFYNTWHKDKYDIIPKIDGTQGKAMNEILQYLKKIYHSQKKEGTDEEILGGWQAILNRWSELDSFTQNKTRLSDINSHLQNIIKQLKNGHNGKRNAKVSDGELGEISHGIFNSQV